MTTEVTIVEAPADEPAPAAIEDAAEDAAAAVVEVSEDAADAAVTVAAIEADRDVEIAQIQADADIERMRLAHEADLTALRLELSECRMRAETAEALNIELRERSLTPPQSEATTDQHLSSETNPHHESDANVQTPDNPVEASDPAPEPVKKRKALRWI